MSLFKKNKGEQAPLQQPQQPGFQQPLNFQGQGQVPVQGNIQQSQVPQYNQQPQYNQPVQQMPVFQAPPQPVYTDRDRPIVEEKTRKFIKRELRKQRFMSSVEVSIFLLITLAFSIMISLFVTSSPEPYVFYGGITGIEHLGWMGTLGIVSLFILGIFSLKLYVVAKDFKRFNVEGQNQSYIPITLKKRYRSLRANNTFIHYFSFLAYIGIALTVGIIYILDGQSGVVGENLTISSLNGNFNDFSMYLGISAACVLALHLTWVFLRVKKAKVYDVRFGYEIVPNEEIIALKKRNRKLCMFITLVLILVGVIGYFIVKKLKPGIPKLLPSFKK